MRDIHSTEDANKTEISVDTYPTEGGTIVNFKQREPRDTYTNPAILDTHHEDDTLRENDVPN